MAPVDSRADFERAIRHRDDLRFELEERKKKYKELRIDNEDLRKELREIKDTLEKQLPPKHTEKRVDAGLKRLKEENVRYNEKIVKRTLVNQVAQTDQYVPQNVDELQCRIDELNSEKIDLIAKVDKLSVVVHQQEETEETLKEDLIKRTKELDIANFVTRAKSLIIENMTTRNVTLRNELHYIQDENEHLDRYAMETRETYFHSLDRIYLLRTRITNMHNGIVRRRVHRRRLRRRQMALQRARDRAQMLQRRRRATMNEQPKDAVAARGRRKPGSGLK